MPHFSLSEEFIKACEKTDLPQSSGFVGMQDASGTVLHQSTKLELPSEVSGARFGNITIFPDDPAPPPHQGAVQAPLAQDIVPSSTEDASGTLSKPIRKRGAGAKTWRPNPSFPMDDYEGVIEAAAQHGMSAGSFIVALCQAYIYCHPFILQQHLRPPMPPMTAEQQREFSGVANNLNQIARVMNEGRKTAIAHGSAYPNPPVELNALLQAIYVLLKVK